MQQKPAGDTLLVVCLCAAWCDTCGEFRETFSRLERTHPQANFVWLDVEDDSALVGEVDIENFPTLAVFRGEAPLFYGVTMPQEALVSRTLGSFLEKDARAVSVPAEIAGLPAALRSRLERGDRG